MSQAVETLRCRIKQLRVVWLSCLFVLLMLWLAATRANADSAGDDEVRGIVYAAPMFAPWITPLGDGYEGIAYEMLAEAAQRSNVDLVIKGVPIMRTYAYLARGDADFSIIPTSDFSRRFSSETEYYAIPRPIFNTKMALFGHLGNEKLDGFALSNLKQFKIGTIRVALQLRDKSKLSELFFDDENLVTFADNRSLVKALVGGRIDLAVMPSLAMLQEAANAEVAREIRQLWELDFQSGSYLVWSKRSTYSADSPVAMQFREALEQLACDGSIDKIFQDWLIREHPSETLGPHLADSFKTALTAYCP